MTILNILVKNVYVNMYLKMYQITKCKIDNKLLSLYM